MQSLVSRSALMSAAVALLAVSSTFLLSDFVPSSVMRTTAVSFYFMAFL